MEPTPAIVNAPLVTTTQSSAYDRACLFLLEKGPIFGQKMTAHVKRQMMAYALLMLLVWLVLKDYQIGMNATFSLPQTFFIVKRDAPVAKGDYVAFIWHGGGPYAKGKSFIKQLAGGAGDTVAEKNRQFYVNGQALGVAKPYSKFGVPLDMGPTGVIPPDKFYVATPHPDSLDSRYALTGWIDRSQITGKVVWKW
jgi:conjugal transfer pilin signal peptidase TrbI